MTVDLEELRAMHHVAERVRIAGVHNTRLCPYPARAMCSYYRVIEGMIADGRWPDNLETASPMLPPDHRSSNEQERSTRVGAEGSD